MQIWLHLNLEGWRRVLCAGWRSVGNSHNTATLAWLSWELGLALQKWFLHHEMYSIAYVSCRELLRLNSPSEYDRSSEGSPYHHTKFKINNLSWECHTQIYKLSQINTSLRIQDKAECGKVTEMGVGTEKCLHGGWRGDAAHTFLMEGHNWGWGYHTKLKKQDFLLCWESKMDFQLICGGCVGGWMVPAALYSHFVAPSCKLKHARIQDGGRVWQKQVFFCFVF